MRENKPTQISSWKMSWSADTSRQYWWLRLEWTCQPGHISVMSLSIQDHWRLVLWFSINRLSFQRGSVGVNEMHTMAPTGQGRGGTVARRQQLGSACQYTLHFQVIATFFPSRWIINSHLYLFSRLFNLLLKRGSEDNSSMTLPCCTLLQDMLSHILWDRLMFCCDFCFLTPQTVGTGWYF